MRKFALILTSIAIGILVPLVALEAALRFLPVQDGMMAVPVNESTPVFRFEPNRDLTWSRGWDFSIVNRVHVNNEGFVNDQDYALSSKKPLFAIVGDSYVEAVMVPYVKTVQGRLAELVAIDARVYSFAASGAPLSQYVIWAKEARQRWGAQALAIVIVGNDFDESLAKHKQGPGFHHYVYDDNGELTLTRFDHEPAWWRELARKSALIRYLVLNLQAPDQLKLFWKTLPSFAPSARAQDYVGNTRARASKTHIEQSRHAVRAFLRDIVALAGWSPDQVVFVLDGIRYPSDNTKVRSSYFMQMREYFMAEAQKVGFETVDMDRYFFARRKLEPGVAFDFPTDSHWNAIAHGVAAEAIAESAVFSRWQQNYVRPRIVGETPDVTPAGSHGP